MNVRNPDITGPCRHLKIGARIRAQHERIKNLTTHPALTGEGSWEEEVNAGSRTLRLATLERLGGAEQIVRRHLDGVMDSLDGARQEVCAKFFDRLVTPSGAKIGCAIKDLTEWA